jgi:hypothetical protein
MSGGLVNTVPKRSVRSVITAKPRKENAKPNQEKANPIKESAKLIKERAKLIKERKMQPVKSVINGAAENSKNLAAEAASAGNVDKIRDILFGSHIKDYEIRFARLEESLQQQTADLRDSTRKRLDALENYVRKEVEALQARGKAERDERLEAAKQLTREIKDCNDAVSKKLREMDDQGEETARALREDILRQSKDLLDEMRTRTVELNALLDRRVQELTHSKTDRAALAGLFSEISLRLKDEFEIPGLER